MKNLKIALTGGPCGGKTTSIEKIQEEFSEKGYKIIVVPEAATLLINSGIRPFGNNALSMYDFQKYVMSTQMYLENLAKKCAEEADAKTIIICDRGILDDRAYVSEEEYKELLRSFDLTLFDTMNRYDLVIHLKTAADGKEEFYTLDNNASRTETPEEAREKDKKTLDAWVGHDNLKIIGNDTDFEEKVNKVTRLIHSMTDSIYPIQKQEKYLVECDLEKLLETNPVVQDIEQYVICKYGMEMIYRKTTSQGEVKYSVINKKDTSINDERIVTRRNITERDYYDGTPRDKEPIRKKRYCFIYDNQYFRLDVFNYGLNVLEIEETNKTTKRTIPEFIIPIEDISENTTYRNKSLYDKINEHHKQYVKK